MPSFSVPHSCLLSITDVRAGSVRASRAGSNPDSGIWRTLSDPLDRKRDSSMIKDRYV